MKMKEKSIKPYGKQFSSRFLSLSPPNKTVWIVKNLFEGGLSEFEFSERILFVHHCSCVWSQCILISEGGARQKHLLHCRCWKSIFELTSAHFSSVFSCRENAILMRDCGKSMEKFIVRRKKVVGVMQYWWGYSLGCVLWKSLRFLKHRETWGRVWLFKWKMVLRWFAEIFWMILFL